MSNELKEVKIIRVEENKTPRFVKTKKVIAYREDRGEYPWEKVEVGDSVHIIVYNKTKKEVMLVKQVRIPVLVNDDSQKGHVYELCAGLVDKDKPIAQIAQEEIEEELGYKIPVEDVKYIQTLKSSVGSAGSNTNLFYAFVDESQKVSDGGGLDSEDIEVVRISIHDLGVFMEDIRANKIHTDPITSYGLLYLASFINLNE